MSADANRKCEKCQLLMRDDYGLGLGPLCHRCALAMLADERAAHERTKAHERELAQLVCDQRDVHLQLRTESDAVQSEAAAMRDEITRAAAELRHAYHNLIDGRVTAAGVRSFADGLIAPQIRRLERLTSGNAGRDLATRVTLLCDVEKWTRLYRKSGSVTHETIPGTGSSDLPPLHAPECQRCKLDALLVALDEKGDGNDKGLREKQRAIAAWCNWYSKRLRRGDDYSGYEQDLFEAFGCIAKDEKGTNEQG